MYRCFKEPPLEELLNDPIARLLMASDRVEIADLRALLNAASKGRTCAGSRREGAADSAVPARRRRC
jgi:hypothetical protein